MLPVLIVCYLRPQKLEVLLENLRGSQRQIYIFIDRADELNFELNRKVYETAERFALSLDLKILWAEKNFGVGLGVPAALDWVFEFVEEIIVIEDDCLPTDNALKYFDEQACKLYDSILMACGTSPWNPEDQNSANRKLTLSSYPLIWGWSTNRISWIKLSKMLRNEIHFLPVLKALISNPMKLLPISFFYAATIRVKRGKLKAWDSPLALEMLLSKYKSIIPNFTLVENSGQDLFASHFLNPGSRLEDIVSKSYPGKPSKEIEFSRSATRLTDQAIKKRIYKMKVRQIFAPLKASFGR